MTRAIALTAARLRRLPLPKPDDDGDKEHRGRVLVVGGSTRVPGAVLLSGVATLRAGAGKLQLATVRSVAPALGVAVPEAMVVALPQSRDGEIVGARAGAVLKPHAEQADAILIGPGMTLDRSARAMIKSLGRAMKPDAALILDAGGILALRADDALLHPLHGRAILTPHAGEMASLLGIDRRDVEFDPRAIAEMTAERFGAVVALKGAESWIAAPDGTVYRYALGGVGLATSGSGDTLAGIAAGLVARGARPAQAVAWAVYLHGAAGRVLARRTGPIGFLARELLDEIPHLMVATSRGRT